ncbi:MAG: pyruvate kinase [Caedimonas sp.]|nr:pyruvate kinase [Caedimonas sp.]
MRRHRYAKIVATLGPASSTFEMIETLFLAGVDNFRLNFSHGSYDDHQSRYDLIRSVETKYGRPLGVIADLQGPKLRVGVFRETEIILREGDRFRLDLSPEVGDQDRVCLPHPEIFAALEPGTELLLDDGKLKLRVISFDKDSALTYVVTGGALSNRKGVNVPHVALPISPLTEKDRRDLRFAMEMGADWVALSFVQRPEDVQELRKLVGENVGIISKLEKPMAITHLEDIVRLSDSVMVARGDLGVEMAPEDVPSVQKKIISACRAVGRPVIVATQMLDSMVHAPIPTRAEASDVATAVYDGVDAVMLSAESASGDYPVESVAMMNRIIERVEQDPLYRTMLASSHTEAEATPSDAITAAARQVAHTLSSKVIATLTNSGSTTLRAARERPMASILGLTPNLRTARRLMLAWGTHPVVIEELGSIAEAFKKAAQVAREEGFAEVGDEVVMTAAAQLGKANPLMVFKTGSTRLLRIMKIGEDEQAL